MRGMKVEYFSRPVVEHVLDGGELLMADLAKVHALGQEPAHQAVGVLVGAALAGAASRRPNRYSAAARRENNESQTFHAGE